MPSSSSGKSAPGTPPQTGPFRKLPVPARSDIGNRAILLSSIRRKAPTAGSPIPTVFGSRLMISRAVIPEMSG